MRSKENAKTSDKPVISESLSHLRFKEIVSCIMVNGIINLFGISEAPKGLKKSYVVLTLTQNSHDRSFLLFNIVGRAKGQRFVDMSSSAPRKNRVVQRQSLALDARKKACGFFLRKKIL